MVHPIPTFLVASLTTCITKYAASRRRKAGLFGVAANDRSGISQTNGLLLLRLLCFQSLSVLLHDNYSATHNAAINRRSVYAPATIFHQVQILSHHQIKLFRLLVV